MAPINKQCNETVWITPRYIIDAVHAEFDGDFCDPATQPENPTLATSFFTQETNGLNKDWGHSWFLNPPYGKEMKHWLKAAHEQKGRGILLVPHDARSCTGYWRDFVLTSRLSAICYLSRRVPFLDADGIAWQGNPHSSQILFFNFLPRSQSWGDIGVLADWRIR